MEVCYECEGSGEQGANGHYGMCFSCGGTGLIIAEFDFDNDDFRMAIDLIDGW